MSNEQVLSDMQIESLEKIIKYKNEQIHLLAERNETQAKFLEFFEMFYPQEYAEMLDSLVFNEKIVCCSRKDDV